MHACLVGLTQQEYDALIPVLCYLDISWEDYRATGGDADLVVVGARVAVEELLDCGLPIISLRQKSDLLHTNLYYVPLPWREALVAPILKQLIPRSNLPRRQSVNLNIYIRHVETLLIKQALLVSNGVVSKAADLLQIQRTTLIEKMRRYNIDKAGS